MRLSIVFVATVWIGLGSVLFGADDQARDLNPVTFKQTPVHPPIVLVENGQSRAVIVAAKGTPAKVVTQLQDMIEKATGARLAVTNRTAGPAIMIGDSPETAAEGLVSSNMPPEGFSIKTASNRVYIAGNGEGVHWGVCEFLERDVGARWYFPDPGIGLCIPKRSSLSIQPVWLEDAPVFRMRKIWPPCGNPWHGNGTDLAPIQTFLRDGNSWPTEVVVHSPNWSKAPFKDQRPEVFQLKADGTRDYAVLCYGNAKTLETYLDQIQNYLDKKRFLLGIKGRAITVSPADVELACYCPDCRKLWNDHGGTYGAASGVMATFVDRLACEVQKRWPTQGFTVIFLPYLNYTTAPDGFKFPGNVEVQICGMPGMASYKEPAIRDSEQANIDRWLAISGRKIQSWHYDCWPADKDKAAYQYPHVIKGFYVRNREKTVGSFINGEYDHWPRQSISLYCWMKCLWNPGFDVDAAVDAFCADLFGPAAKTMRELVGMQMDGWEKSTWPGGRFSSKGVYACSFPRETVKRMEALFAQAMKEGASDPLVKVRLDYYGGPLREFFDESRHMAEGFGFHPLLVQKVGENPVMDGKLDGPVWERAEAVSFVQATGKDQGKPAVYATQVKAVWTLSGVTFGFRMSEPAPDALVVKNGGHDNGAIWWDDNAELLLDVTGKNEGEYYHFIINADGNTWDSRMKDASWECQGMKSKACRDKDFWSMEVYLPFSAFPEAAKPGPGNGQAAWSGNFCRHRVSSGPREYQRMNTTGAASSENQTDFAPIRFVE